LPPFFCHLHFCHLKMSRKNKVQTVSQRSCPQ
jgi:hypothetical protein